MGLTAEGFDIKFLNEILSDMEGVQLQLISPNLDVQPTALIGVLNGIMAQALSELWELAGALYNGMDRDQAEGDQLAALALLVGTLREEATATQVEGGTCNLDAGFSAPAGTMFASISGGDPDVLFTNKELMENTGGTPDDIVGDWEAVEPGATQCLAGTLTVISVPRTGWNSITNPDDGTIGQPIQTDPGLRLLTEQEITAAGSATAAAIKADVLQDLPDTISCTVLHNDGTVTDSNGVPPQHVEVIAYLPGNTPDDDQALAEVLFDSKAAGIGTYSGSGTSKTVTDDASGIDQTVYYTRPTTVPIYVVMTVERNVATFPADGEDQIKAAMVLFAQSEYEPGARVTALKLRDVGFDIAGVTDVPVFQLGIAPAPVGTANLAMTIRQIATLSSANIGITLI